ncbi:DUF1801 domain-containing protein [Mycoplasmatota bacterium WC30]
MYKIKTIENNQDINKYIESISDEKRRNDSIKLMDIISEVTDEKPKMWGNSIIGYGTTEYSNTTLKKQPWFLIGFSPRKAALTLYVKAYSNHIYELTKKLGLKHGKGCIYIKDLDKVDLVILKSVLNFSLKK